MKEAIIVAITTIITALISGGITHLASKESNKIKLELVKSEAEVKYKELENQIIFRDKDIEQMRVQHELDLKSKEADAMNPLMMEMFHDYIKNPEETQKRIDKITQQTGNQKAGKFQGYNKSKKIK